MKFIFLTIFWKNVKKSIKNEYIEQLAWKMMGRGEARGFRSQNVGLFYEFHEKSAFWKIFEEMWKMWKTLKIEVQTERIQFGTQFSKRKEQKQVKQRFKK